MASVEDWGSDWYDLTSGVPAGTSWPAGRYAVPLARLKQLLALSARWHARTAVHQFVADDRNDLLQAAISAGTAVELLAKAFLASIDNALLTERGDRDSLLLLTGHQEHARTPPSGVRTLGAAEALAVCRHIKPTLPFEGDPTKHVCLRVRNSAAHMALVDRRELTVGVVQMVRYVSSLLEALELDPRKFWDEPGFEAASSLLDKAKSEMQQRVEIKVTVAKRNLELLIATLPDEQVDVVLRAMAGRGPFSRSDHEEEVECPVCGQSAYLICGVERGPLEYEPDGEDYVGGAYVELTAYPISFECVVCKLDLEGEELEEFDFPTEIELDPDTNPREAWEYEPDEDYFRDR